MFVQWAALRLHELADKLNVCTLAWIWINLQQFEAKSVYAESRYLHPADVCSAELEAVVEWKKSGDRPAATAAAGCSLAVAAAIRRSRCAPQIRINSLHKLDERPLVCRSEMDVPVTIGDFFDHWVYRSSPALRYRQPSCGLLQRSAVWHIHCSHTPTTDGTECRCSLGRRNRQVRAHHTGATWHSPLAASGRENAVQDCCSDILTVCEALVRTISSKLSVQSLKCHVGHTVLPAAVTCSFRGQTRPSANDVFLSRLLLSGTH